MAATKQGLARSALGALGIHALLVAACGPSSGAGLTGGGGGVPATGGTSVTGAGGGPTVGSGGAPIFLPPTGAGGGSDDGGLPSGACGKSTVQGEVITETRIETRIETRTETRIETRTETRIETRTETREVVKPVALYLMLDQSGSMVDGDKWGAAVNAINGFAADPLSAGFTAALQMFSFNFLGNPPGCALCDGSDCRPPMVPWAALPGGAPAIATALVRIPIGAGTPIEAGLRGATMGCQDYEAAHPQEDCVAVLITDGAPSTCDVTGNGLAAIASSAAQRSVPTFAIGMAGADFALLDQIAAGGGTDCDPASARRACNANSAAEFRAALNLIRTTVTQTTTVEVPVEVEVQVEVQVPVEVEVQVEVQVPVTAAVPCEWGLPASQTSENTDLNQVNVDLTDRATSVKEELGRVPSEADCGAFANGWYYDNPLAPTRIIACPNVCERVKTMDARVDILVGCESRPPIVR